MKALLHHVLEVSPASDRRLLAAAILGSAVLMALVAILQLVGP
jgi:hypothetical protein